jgi:hypothetical protein
MNKEIINEIQTCHGPIVHLITITGQIRQEIDTVEIETIDHIPHLGMTEETKGRRIKTDQDPSLLIGIHIGIIIAIADQCLHAIKRGVIAHQIIIQDQTHQTDIQARALQIITDLIRGIITETDHLPLTGKIILSQMNSPAQ